MRPNRFDAYTLFLILTTWLQPTYVVGQDLGPLAQTTPTKLGEPDTAHRIGRGSSSVSTQRSTYNRLIQSTTGDKQRASEVRTIALVGNGRSLLSSKQGEFIDGHDLVGRFNFFRIQGFEADVGRRTDLWFLNQVSSISR